MAENQQQASSSHGLIIKSFQSEAKKWTPKDSQTGNNLPGIVQIKLFIKFYPAIFQDHSFSL